MRKLTEPEILIESAEIVAIGTELLIGQTLNSNAFYLAKQLNELGINCYHRTVVGDNPQRLKEALTTAVSRSDLVITSGGLGPTADDISMAVSAEVAGIPLVLHEPSTESIEQYFRSSGRVPCENNWKQAMLPRNAYVLENHNGTAPGAVMRFESDEREKAIACLPGPPDELKPMFEDFLKPWIAKRTKYIFKNRYLHMIGIGESDAETRVRDLIDKQENPTIAPYASPGEVCFRLTQRMTRAEREDHALDDLADQIYQRLGKYIYEDGQRSLPQIILDILKKRGQSVAFAESCTAGLISSQLGEIPGASEVFKGSVVSYANQVKADVLGVSPEILKKDGAVSERAALAMAKGAAELLQTDLSVAVTGIAGPDGGSREKPVGTVYIAARYQGRELVKRYQINGNRNRVRTVAALRAYHLAWQILQLNEK